MLPWVLRGAGQDVGTTPGRQVSEARPRPCGRLTVDGRGEGDTSTRGRGTNRNGTLAPAPILRQVPAS